MLRIEASGCASLTTIVLASGVVTPTTGKSGLTLFRTLPRLGDSEAHLLKLNCTSWTVTARLLVGGRGSNLTPGRSLRMTSVRSGDISYDAARSPTTEPSGGLKTVPSLKLSSVL